jgi:CheY-like chemotaxis protein
LSFINTRLEGTPEFLKKLRVYALLAPHLEVGGYGNSARRLRTAGQNVLVACKAGKFLAMGANVGFNKTSCGYVGHSAITLDVLMAKGDGFETLVSLRKEPETANVPVILVSIVDQREVGFALGATDYLIKPIGKPVLLETIRRCVPMPGGDDHPTILLVDDDHKTLELLEETLRAAGYETQSVQSGARALEVLSSKLVGAVLLDLLMPGMDGFQVIRYIRAQQPLRELPIFVMTAKNLSSEEVTLLNRETQAFLQKGRFWQHQLIGEIGKVLIRGKRVKGAAQQ